MRRLTALTVFLLGLACGGVLDPDGQRCLLDDDECAAHVETRLEEDGLPAERVTYLRELLSKSCGYDNARACMVYGKELGLEREGFEMDRAKAIEALERSCKADYGEGCFQLARVIGSEGPYRDQKRAIELYNAQCDAEPTSAAACNNGALLIEAESGPSVETVRRFAKACDANDRLGCKNLASRYDRGRGVERDAVKARNLWDRLCTSELWQSCYDAGWSWRMTEDGPVDVEKGNGLIDKACANEFLPACATVADDKMLGRHRDKDIKAGFEEHVVLCGKEFASSCRVAGAVLSKGAEGVDADVARSRDLLEKACKGDDAEGCYRLSNGLEGDAATAAYNRACQAGHGVGCALFAVDLRAAEKFAEAAAAFAKSCELETAAACFDAGDIYTDFEKGRPWFKRGCELGHKPSCRKL